MNINQKNIRIVLVETSHPGNIGAVARAMKNMYLSNLYLVNPRNYPSSEATARASGADEILQHAIQCTSLNEALSGCHLAVGASARLRTIAWPQLDARKCGELIVRESVSSQVAIVFGRENSGLSNQELNLCHYLVHIPANPEYSSLNISAAVQVITYEVMMSFSQTQAVEEIQLSTSHTANKKASNIAKMDAFFTHLEQALTEIHYLKPPNNIKLKQRLRRFFNRARPDKTELDILHGILSAAQGRKYAWLKQHQDLINNEIAHIKNSQETKRK